MKDKTTAGILAIVLGDFGIHKFYLGQTGLGIVYLLFCWTGIPGLIGIVEGIIYLTQPQEQWDAQHNSTMNGTVSTQAQSHQATQTLAQLDQLRQSGAITEDEYQEKKSLILSRI